MEPHLYYRWLVSELLYNTNHQIGGVMIVSEGGLELASGWRYGSKPQNMALMAGILASALSISRLMIREIQRRYIEYIAVEIETAHVLGTLVQESTGIYVFCRPPVNFDRLYLDIYRISRYPNQPKAEGIVIPLPPGSLMGGAKPEYDD